jgi:apolipoprotein N-acyltransferase
VDLDGALIQTDLLWESLARFLRRNPFRLFPVLWWWGQGRAFLKRQLAARVTIDSADLPYNAPFLAFLREQKRSGRKLVLATASDREMALPVANHVGLFDEVLGSDGRQNLRGANKVRLLIEKFGERGFDYAGNAAPDLKVWRAAREAIVVNASRALVNQAAQCTKLGPVFIENYSPFGTLTSFLRELFWRSGYLAAFAAGLLLTAAFPNVGIAGFAWVAPALMVAAAYGQRGMDAFRVGYVAGLTHFLTSLYWLVLMPVTGLPILAWAALCAYLALYPAIWVWLVVEVQSSEFGVQSLWSSRLLWSLGGAAVWVALEMVRAQLFTGFPWNFLGVSQYQLVPLIQLASVTGVYGISFLVVWASLSLYSAASVVLHRPNVRLLWQAEIILPFAVVVGLFVFGFSRLNEQNQATSSLEVTTIQPSFQQTLIWNPGEDERRFSELLALSEQALTHDSGTLSINLGSQVGPLTPPLSPKGEGEKTSPNSGSDGVAGASGTDLLIWPESAVPETDLATCRAISQFAQSNRVWIILNGEDAEYLKDATNYFNAAYAVSPDGQWTQVYHKQRLVVFGEYIPLVHWLPFIKYLTPIEDGWTAGDRAVQFEITPSGERQPRRSFGAKAGPREPVIELNSDSSVASPPRVVKTSPLICFEDTFPGLGRDATDEDTDFLVNLTNDGWFRQSAEQWQHMANAVFRAVENGLPLVCCANNGVTCWIDAYGRVRETFRDPSGSVYGAGAMTFELPVGGQRAATFYHRHGDWFAWGCVGIGILALTWRILIRKNPGIK